MEFENIHPSTVEAVDAVDAAIFTGDMTVSDARVMKGYCERWLRGLATHLTPTVDEVMSVIGKNNEWSRSMAERLLAGSYPLLEDDLNHQVAPEVTLNLKRLLGV